MFDHTHHHDQHPHPSYSKAFLVGIVLNAGFVAVEIFYGLYANSLALLADAGHNAIDVLGLLLAWGAMALTKIRPSKNFTYGLQSASIMAALANAMLIMLAVGALAIESLRRLQDPHLVDQTIVMLVAGIGVVINSITAWLFYREATHDLNIRGAYLHMVTDALVSVGVVAGGWIGLRTGWLWIDPALSLFIAVVIVAGTWSLMTDSARMALYGTPKHVDADAVKAFLASQAGVREVHDLHIWALGTTETALSAHLQMPDGHPGDAFLRDVILALEERFHIHHSTIQIEMGDVVAESCESC